MQVYISTRLYFIGCIYHLHVLTALDEAHVGFASSNDCMISNHIIFHLQIHICHVYHRIYSRKYEYQKCSGYARIGCIDSVLRFEDIKGGNHHNHRVQPVLDASLLHIMMKGDRLCHLIEHAAQHLDRPFV